MSLENWPKLITNEDPYHIHKILGACCLANFVYRWTCLFRYGTMYLDNPLGAYTLALHAALSMTSLVFHLPRLRHPSKPMIYPEFRAHSILFAGRSVVVCYIYYAGLDYRYAMLTCFAVMYLADRITAHYRSNSRTMRNMPFDPIVPEEQQQAIVAMHSRMQIGATVFMIGNMNTAFGPLLAIQMAAFLMTLVRKGILHAQTWHLIYSVLLWANFELFPQYSPAHILIQRCVFELHARVFFPNHVNKYVAWICHFGAMVLYQEWGAERWINRVVYLFVRPDAVAWILRVLIWHNYTQNLEKYWGLFLPTPVAREVR